MTKEERAALYDLAMRAAEFSYSPYSRFSVGAALLCQDGKTFTGCNIENQSFPAGICAERSALAAAVSAGERSFTAIAVASPQWGITPCGMCRQALSEFGDLLVIYQRQEGDLECIPLSRLLPSQFNFSEQ